MAETARSLGGSALKVLHVGVGNLGAGGVATYVRTLVGAQRAQGIDAHLAELWSVGNSMPEVQTRLTSLEELNALHRSIAPRIVHLHSQLPDYHGLPDTTVLTAHEHSAHCPSGGRYLEGQRKVCTREFGWAPCLWGHFVDRCGSRSPKWILNRFRITSMAPTFPGHWIAPSSYTRDQLLSRAIDPHRVHLIANPVCVDDDAPDRDAVSLPLVLFVGRLVANKGCDVLVKAMAMLPDEIRLEILGDGPELDALKKLAASLGLSHRVEFRGWCSPETVKERMSLARAVAVPSLWPEPFGLVALEAGVRGCPVVASSVGGLNDLVIDGETGARVPPDDHAALAEALRPYATDGELAYRVGQNGRERALSLYGIDSHADSVNKLYDLVLKASR